jgi:ABC-type Na+ efflux pump permease subunit
MRWSRVRAIVRKDLTAIRRSRATLVPLIIVPVIFFVGMPVAVGAIGRLTPIDAGDEQDLATLLRTLPAKERERLTRLEPRKQLAVLFFSYQFASLLLIAPLATTMVIAADGIAGERERRTLEALLVTPVRDDELFVGKVLAAAIPAVAIGWGGALTSAVIASTLLGVGPPLLPSPSWLIFAFVGSPAVTVLGLGTIVLLSSRVRGMQEVSQLSGLVVIPLIGLLVVQSTGILLLDWRLALLTCGALWALGLLLLRFGQRTFHREALLRLM